MGLIVATRLGRPVPSSQADTAAHTISIIFLLSGQEFSLHAFIVLFTD